MRNSIYVLGFVLAIAGCKGKGEDKPADEGGAGEAADEGGDDKAPAEPKKPEPEKLSGKVAKVVRCKLSAALGDQYMRSIYVDGEGRAYLFSDDMIARRFDPTDGGCGLAAGDKIEGPRYALEENGAVRVETDKDEASDCASRKIFLASWNGAYYDGAAYLVDDRVLYREDLAGDCKRAEFSKDNTEDGRPADVAVTADYVLVIKFYASGNDLNSVWRFEHGGKLVDKVGLKQGGGTVIGWPDDVSGCGDGLCVTQSGSVVMFGADGSKLGSAKLSEIAGGEEIAGLVDIFELPGRGVYALVKLKTDDKRDIVALDGIYE